MLKAIAYENGMTDSPVASGGYLIQASPLSYSPLPGTFSTAQSVSITCPTSGAAVYYTTDGSTPSQSNGSEYTAPVPISVNTTLKAVACKTGIANSPVESGNYTIQCAMPSFSPVGGVFTQAPTVTISTTSGTTIRYTTDGSTPSETSGTVYTGPVTINSSCKLRAIAYAADMADSPISIGGVYTIQAGAGPWQVITPLQSSFIVDTIDLWGSYPMKLVATISPPGGRRDTMRPGAIRPGMRNTRAGFPIAMPCHPLPRDGRIVAARADIRHYGIRWAVQYRMSLPTKPMM